MKISEMTNDQATEAMIRISTPIANICDDEEAIAIIDSLQKTDNMNAIEIIGKLLPRFITYAFKAHKADLYEIVGALLMEPTAKVGKLNFRDTVQAVRDSYDEILAGFFTQSANAGRKTGG